MTEDSRILARGDESDDDGDGLRFVRWNFGFLIGRLSIVVSTVLCDGTLCFYPCGSGGDGGDRTSDRVTVVSWVVSKWCRK